MALNSLPFGIIKWTIATIVTDAAAIAIDGISAKS